MDTSACARPGRVHVSGAPRILLADDQEDVLAALELLLRDCGFELVQAASPAEVLAAVGERRYDLLLLDMNYRTDTTSGAEGLDLLSEVRRQHPDLPVVLMTAWSTVELAVEAMRRGGSDFVTKPWDNETLLATIRRNLAPERPTGATPETEAREARRVQRGLLPARIPAPEGYLIHPTWHPAGAVGGDYYDVIELEAGRLAFAIGDVSGKGMPAALLMANIQAAVRAAARQAWGPALVCRRLNREVFDNTPTERFVSFFYGVLDLGTGSIRYSNAGHPPPVSIQADGGVVRLDEGGRVLGLFADADYGEGEVRIGPGGRLTLFTDGVTEAENARNEEFGDGRLVELLAGNRTLSCPDLHARLMEAVVGFAGGLSDDATLLTLAANR